MTVALLRELVTEVSGLLNAMAATPTTLPASQIEKRLPPLLRRLSELQPILAPLPSFLRDNQSYNHLHDFFASFRTIHERHIFLRREFDAHYEAYLNSRGSISPHEFLLKRDLVLGEVLGSGGYGTVHRARHLVLEVDRAVKLYAPSAFAEDTKAIRRFAREAAALSALSHPGIVRLFDAGFAGRQAFLVTEFAEGRDLQRVLTDRGPLPYEECLAILRQAAAALAHAHDQGVIHRDIKPSNLVWDGSRLSVVDFGAGTVIEQIVTSRLTTSPVGTSGFIAPELMGTPTLVSPGLDVYSLGVTAHYLLTGHLPYLSGIEHGLRENGVPEAFCQAVVTAVLPPSRRFDSARAFLAALPSGP